MTLLEGIQGGIVAATSLATLPWLFAGALFGLVVGVIPGLSGHFAMAMAVTFLYAMDPATGVVFILAAHATVAQGGGLTTILFSTPGTGQNAATLLDGPKMRDRGEAGVAVGAAMTSCFLGAVFGAMALALLLPVLREVVLLFGPPEIFALALLGLVFVSVLGRRDMLRSLIAGLIGLLFAMVGSGGVIWNPRLTFGIDRLADGLPLVPVILGLFALAEMFKLWRRGGVFASQSNGPQSFARTQADVLRGAGAALRRWGLILRASSIGTTIGLIPGLGSSTAAFIAYGHAKQTSKTPDSFGTGNVEGVIAPEAANDAVEGGALASTIAFGIPGSSSMAILLSAFSILGLQTGPTMLNDRVDVVFLMIFTIVLGNLIGTVCGLFLINPLVQVTTLRTTLIVPWLLTFIFTGAYAGDRTLMDIGIALIFGIIGYTASLLRYSRAALLIGFVLGGAVDRNLNLSLQLEGPFFFLSGLALPLTLGTVAFLIWSLTHSKSNAATVGPTGKVSPDKLPDADARDKMLVLETVFLIALCSAIFTAFIDISGQGWDTARTPVVILCPLAILTSLQLAKVLRATTSGDLLRQAKDALAAKCVGFNRVFGLAASSVGFIATAALLGHYAGVFVFVFALSNLLGGEARSRSLLSAVLATATVFVVFDVCFDIDMYRGLVPRVFSGWRDF